MTKVATAVLVLLLAAFAAAADARTRAASAVAPSQSRTTSVDAALATKLAAAGPDSTLEAVVVLDKQAALPSLPGSKRGARLAAVVDSLHSTATQEQRPLLELLGRRKAAGRVSKIVPLWVFNGLVVEAKPEVLSEVARRPEVREVRLSSTVQAPTGVASAAPESNLSVVNAPALWDLGYRGQGVVVANMDTGVDVSHPELSASWRGGSNSWYDPNGEHPSTPTDVSGHGTWTMGVMVGGDRGGTAVGVAPAAKWIAAKIFNDRGVATTARIHQAFQWLLDPDHNPVTGDAPNVVNGSWTLGAAGCNLEFQLDLRALRAAGVLPVFAAGNSGPSAGSGYSPANNPEALAVGATNNNDAIAAWSSRGPSACDGGVFPEVSAPGVDIQTTDLYGYYVAESGTSMAAPHVSGALALLLGAFPNLPADRQESALEQSAADLGVAGPDNTFGYGRLDALAAYNWLATSPDFTLAASPSSATTSAGGSVAYTVTVGSQNGFAGDVSLSLAGLTSSQADWTFTPALIPDGDGSAQLNVTTSETLAPGSYPLTVSATSGSTTHTVVTTLVIPAPPDFAVSVSPGSATAEVGGSVAYTVAIDALNGFAGSVSLSLSGLSASQASWTFTPATVSGAGTSQLGITASASLVPGRYPLVISGTSGSNTHTVGATLVVSGGDFTISSTPTSAATAPGGSVTFAVAVGALNGFSGSVSLSLSGLSASQATWTFTPSTISGSGSSQLGVATSASIAPGSYALTITGSSGATTHSVAVTLTVTAPAGFSLDATPASIAVWRGGTATYTINVSRSGGFTGTVSLSISGLPFGAQASFSPNPVGLAGTPTLRVTTTFWTVRGTFTLTITGKSGLLTRKTTTKLSVM